MQKSGSCFGLHICIVILFVGSSCRKDLSVQNQQKTPVNNIGFVYYSDKTIKINQAILVYDSTRIRDSLDFVNTPTDKYYEWTTVSGSGCNAIISNHLPMTYFIFNCAGDYMLSAKIYSDSTKHFLVGHTDTLEILVSQDTLYQAQAIQKNDTLNIRPGIVIVRSGEPGNNQLLEVYMQMVITTTKQYEYTTPYIQFEYTTTTGPNMYAYQFYDSIRLTSFPFAFGNGIKSAVDGSIDLHGLTYGVPAKLSIIWLGTIYEGTIALLNEYQWTTNWVNQGFVKMIY